MRGGGRNRNSFSINNAKSFSCTAIENMKLQQNMFFRKCLPQEEKDQSQ